jgi:hypothetical protein
MLLTLVLFTGCDPVFGVSRRARVALMPEPARVSAVVRETPGVDYVQYSCSEGGRPLTFTGVKTADQVHTFSYSGGSNVHGTLQFVVDYRQRVEYSQTLMQLGSRPPQAWIDSTRPVMIQIEKRLEEECGLLNLHAVTAERCIGVRCR